MLPEFLVYHKIVLPAGSGNAYITNVTQEGDCGAVGHIDHGPQQEQERHRLHAAAGPGGAGLDESLSQSR